MAKIFIIIFSILLLGSWGCKPTKKIQSSPEKASTKSIAIVDTGLLKKNNPVLIIENNNILWPEKCFPDSNYNFKLYSQKAKEYLKTDSLISIGRKGIQTQKIGDPFCLQGECYGNQFAFHLDKKEEKGILVPSYFANPTSKFLKMDRMDYRKLPMQAKLFFQPKDFYAVDTYQDSAQTQFFQVAGNGYMQENDWYLFNDIQWRLGKKEKDSVIFSEWNKMDFNTTNLPEPLGIIEDGNWHRIIWYQGVGICCPQESKTWITLFSIIENKMWKFDSEKTLGGLGQPCD